MKKYDNLQKQVARSIPMKWVDTDKNAHLRKDKGYVSVPANHKSRLVGCGNFETTEGLRMDSPAGDVDSHNRVCSGVHRLMFPVTRTTSRTDSFKDKKLIESCCTVSQLKVFRKKELQVKQFWLHVYLSTVQRMQDEVGGFD